MKLRLHDYSYEFFKALAFREDIEVIEQIDNNTVVVKYTDGSETELKTKFEDKITIEDDELYVIIDGNTDTEYVLNTEDVFL